jgi:hypothetical protein
MTFLTVVVDVDHSSGDFDVAPLMRQVTVSNIQEKLITHPPA